MADPTGNNWTIFNGAGAVVADNMPLDVARAYLTPERAERGWNAVYCLVVRDPADFPAGVGAPSAEAQPASNSNKGAAQQ